MRLTKAVAIAMLVTLIGAAPAGATVLCFGSDGHVSAEAEAADHHPTGGVSLQHGVDANHVANSDVADHSTCLDVVLALATESKLGKHVAQSEFVLPVAVLPMPTRFVPSATASIEASPGSAAGLAARFASLSRIVLRI